MENVAALESKGLLPTTFAIQIFLFFLKVQTAIKSHSLMMGASYLAILIFSTRFFHFWHLLSYSP